MTTAKAIIANRAADHMPKPSHNMFASDVVRSLDAAGYVIVPKEPTNDQVIAALEWAQGWMRKHGVDGLSPFSEYPKVGETTKGMYRAMVSGHG